MTDCVKSFTSGIAVCVQLQTVPARKDWTPYDKRKTKKKPVFWIPRYLKTFVYVMSSSAMEAGASVGLNPRRINLKVEARRKAGVTVPGTPTESQTMASTPIPQNDCAELQQDLPNPVQQRKALAAKKNLTKRQKSRRGPEVQKEISLTVGQVGTDIDTAVFDKLALFLQREATMALIAFERGDTNLQLHIQSIVGTAQQSR
ncbi:hypothetical protein R1sor_020483 [Riccia sorocarpa]|uniref:Uncharacterized protein n=1 Tax=Riccia sorocarpa TaxID=122646 RepID=A0ABD3IJS7_9MARC